MNTIKISDLQKVGISDVNNGVFPVSYNEKTFSVKITDIAKESDIVNLNKEILKVESTIQTVETNLDNLSNIVSEHAQDLQILDANLDNLNTIINDANTNLLESITDTQSRITILENAGHIQDAPEDGKVYGRKDTEWIEVVSDTVNPADFISNDNNNALGLGTDNNLYVSTVEARGVQSVNIADGETLISIAGTSTDIKLNSTTVLKDSVEKAKIIIKDGNGSKYLADNGEYKTVTSGSSSGGISSINTVSGETFISVNNTDSANPIIFTTMALQTALSTSYKKPPQGIPYDDLSVSVIESLIKAENAATVSALSAESSLRASLDNKVDAHNSDTIIHVSNNERNKWNGYESIIPNPSTISQIGINTSSINRLDSAITDLDNSKLNKIDTAADSNKLGGYNANNYLRFHFNTFADTADAKNYSANNQGVLVFNINEGV